LLRPAHNSRYRVIAKAFASQADLEETEVPFAELADGVYGYTAEGDPNAGVIVGPDSVVVLEALATPVLAQKLVAEIRKVTDKPIKHVVLSHYHAVRFLGASAYGASEIIMSQDTRDLVAERGQQDYESEARRFPRLFQGIESVPGLTWPTQTFTGQMTLWLGDREVQIAQVGRAHTKGDTIVWLPKEKVMFSGDIVEYHSALYCGGAYLQDWGGTLDAVQAYGAEKIVPGRGAALDTPQKISDAFKGTRAFVDALYGGAKQAVEAGKDLKATYADVYAAMHPTFGDWVILDHWMPFNVSRAFDEASGMADPPIWTAERDAAMWGALEG